ncbi:MAG: hypothetical protein H0V62_10480 [Gammaproteobacteria bacterium]|nr:hypothetical protein [Gammaproteobacteria bacterium]
MKQNITLSFDKHLIRKARVIAAKRATSISKMIGDELTRAVEEADRFDKARRQALAELKAGLHLDGHGPVPRDTLHER